MLLITHILAHTQAAVDLETQAVKHETRSMLCISCTKSHKYVIQ